MTLVAEASGRAVCRLLWVGALSLLLSLCWACDEWGRSGCCRVVWGKRQGPRVKEGPRAGRRRGGDGAPGWGLGDTHCFSGAHAVRGRVCGVLLPVEEVRAL